MTLKSLKDSGHIIYKVIAGSRAQGLATERSDLDIKGIYILPPEQFYSLDYPDQVYDERQNEVYYELNKFIALCLKNNPNALELLYTPEESVLYEHSIMKEIKAFPFLTKQLAITIGNYAMSQLKKARSLQRNIFNPQPNVRKLPLEFCWVYKNGETMPLVEFINQRSLTLTDIGLAKINHLKGGYNMFYGKNLGFRGGGSSNEAKEVQLSSIPKEYPVLAMLFYKKDEYSTHCKQHKAYWGWVKERNEERYVSTLESEEAYDGKNMMHTFRLLNMAEEVARTGKLNLVSKQREFLLAIKNSELSVENLFSDAELKFKRIQGLFKESKLPEMLDYDVVNTLLVKVRKSYYNSLSS